MRLLHHSRHHTASTTWATELISDTGYNIYLLNVCRLSEILYLIWMVALKRCASQILTFNKMKAIVIHICSDTVCYLRALLYLLTAAFQSWFLKRLFPMFFTSSATDRTLSTWKQTARNRIRPVVNKKKVRLNYFILRSNQTQMYNQNPSSLILGTSPWIFSLIVVYFECLLCLTCAGSWYWSSHLILDK